MKKKFLPVLTVWAALAISSGHASARKLQIVATFPDLADITQRVGGDKVSVVTIARGTEDPHQVVMRPSFVPKLNRADAVVYIGLTLEHSFLPGLLDAASNPRMRTDPVKECLGPACIDCSEGVHILERPATLSRTEGELHPYGNPHYNVGPQNGPNIARNIEAGLSRIDPANAAVYRKNLAAYLAELDPKIAEWRKRAAGLKGMKAVSYHKDVAYLGAFTGLDFVDTIELKPGVSPTPTHLEALVGEMKGQQVKLILCEQHFSPDACRWLADRTGAKIAVIGVMANSAPGTDTFIKWQEHNLDAILEAGEKQH